ncbi:MAG: glycosyltransferase [Frankiales bacterium]|nr:glycosyltransferase [Frankiales bacterium]
MGGDERNVNMQASASVIIPAHDEAAVIDRCLKKIASSAHPGEFEVIVVCNGCSDRTADLARAYPDVRVVEITTASKVAALNEGDRVATVMPRIYLDADVEVAAAALREVVCALTRGAPAAAPLPVVDTTHSSRSTRAYFRFWAQLGYSTRSALGSGVYALSAEGRSRFADFPDIIADDGFVYSQFAPAERVNPVGATFSIRAPRTLRATLHRRVRIVEGNLRLHSATGARMDVPAPYWHQVVRRNPRLAPNALVYIAVNALARQIAVRRIRRGAVQSWNRDDTSRGDAR